MSGLDWTLIEREAVRVRGDNPEFKGLLDVVVELSRSALPEDVRSVGLHPTDGQRTERYIEHVDECIAVANARYEAEIMPRRRAEAAERDADSERIRAAAERASRL